MNLLITGGAGFIGSSLIPYLLRQAAADQDLGVQKLVNYDKLTPAGNPENLADSETDPRYHFIQGDVCDRLSLANALALHEVDAVVHLAAESQVDQSIANPEPFVTTNLLGTFHVLEACRTHLHRRGKDFRLIYVSPDGVYGSLDPSGAPFRESAALAPNNPCAATRAGARHLVRAHTRTYALPALTVTGSHVFGPFQSPENLVPRAIRRITQGQAVPLFGDGQERRDWLFVEDFCRGIATALLRGQPGGSYHLSGQDERPNIEVVRQLISIVHALQPGCPQPAAETLFQFLPDQPGHDHRCVLDSAWSREELDWKPRESFETGLRKTVQWYLDNEDWIEASDAKRQSPTRQGPATPITS